MTYDKCFSMKQEMRYYINMYFPQYKITVKDIFFVKTKKK